MLELIFLNHKFWELVAFCIFFILVGKKIYKFILDMIDENINNIEKKIKEVENLAFDSGKILEDAVNEEVNLDIKIENIIQDANKKASNYVEKFNEKLYMQFKAAETSFDNYLKIEKERQIEKIEKAMIDKSIETVNYLMINNLKEDEQKKLIDKSINNFDKCVVNFNNK